MKKLSALYNRNLSGEIAIVRVDLNIGNKGIADAAKNLRVTSIVPTVKFLTKRGATVVLVSHRGRPAPVAKRKAVSASELKESTLKPFAKVLSGLLKKEVSFVPIDSKEERLLSEKDAAKIKRAPKGSVFLLENVRFLAGEEANDPAVVRPLAELGTFYVNDAFAVSHRKNASVHAITKLLPSCAGLLLEREIEHLDAALRSTAKPFVVVMGGAKISDKIDLMKNFLAKADYFLVGGGIANTLFAADGLPIGDSIWEKERLPFAKRMLKSGKVVLPMDVAIADRKILDIGPDTIDEWTEVVKSAKVVIWNGPMGVIEDKRYAKGSVALAKAMNASKASVVVGGGETALAFAGIKPKANVFLSTGGGAMLEHLGGKKLPGVEALKTTNKR